MNRRKNHATMHLALVNYVLSNANLDDPTEFDCTYPAVRVLSELIHSPNLDIRNEAVRYVKESLEIIDQNDGVFCGVVVTMALYGKQGVQIEDTIIRNESFMREALTHLKEKHPHWYKDQELAELFLPQYTLLFFDLDIVKELVMSDNSEIGLFSLNQIVRYSLNERIMNKVKPVIEFAMQNLIKDDQLETYKESIIYLLRKLWYMKDMKEYVEELLKMQTSEQPITIEEINAFDSFQKNKIKA